MLTMNVLMTATLVVVFSSQSVAGCDIMVVDDDVMDLLNGLMDMMSDVKTTIDAMETKINVIESGMGDVNTSVGRLNVLETKIDEVKIAVSNMNTTIEDIRNKTNMVDDIKKKVEGMARNDMSSLIDDNHFVASSSCAVDPPAYTQALDDMPYDLPAVIYRATGGFACKLIDGCNGFNYKTNSSGGRWFELFASPPSSFAATADCQYYKKLPAIRDDPCLPNPCQNGGKCCVSCPDYKCTCSSGWKGKDCADRENNTLVQQNIDGSNFFVKNWTDYKAGFGNESGNYWIGNERLHELTKTGQYKLRVDLLYRVDNNWYYAEYSQFIVGNETSKYKMSFSGFEGTTSDNLVNDTQFSTSDVDNDGNADYKCATDKGAGAGFWYLPSCGDAFINTPENSTRGFTWYNDALMGDHWSKLQTSRMRLIY